MSRSKLYWDKHKHLYPFQVQVPHKSEQDLDPREVNRILGNQFLRVPVDGIAHWGFETARARDWFQIQAGVVVHRRA